ncbi:MAG: 50S ribosomal protein L7/L12 [Oscillospiraceae bacterium]|nr:50S ribosomal protein L7/L12 [Oscillospiraceae bacterium]
MADINAIVEEIKALSLLEVKELTDALKETFGVEAVAFGGGAAAGAGAAAAEVEEKTEFDVVLASFDAAAKIKVIKAVREITGQGLADAKKTVEGAPSTLKEAVAKEEAEKIKETLEAAGAKVELK